MVADQDAAAFWIGGGGGVLEFSRKVTAVAK
jgi:hypothetical protein